MITPFIALILITIFVLNTSTQQPYTYDSDLHKVKNAADLRRLLNYKKEHVLISSEQSSSVSSSSSSDDLPTVDEDEETTLVDFSDTNNQVDGVDEGDYVKTDGKNIYVASSASLRIYEVEDGSISLKKEIIIRNKSYYDTKRTSFFENTTTSLFVTSKYIVLIYDIDLMHDEQSIQLLMIDKVTFEIVKEFECKGYISGMRVSNNVLYLIYNEAIDKDYSLLYDFEDGIRNNYEYKDIKYCKNILNRSYTTILSVALDNDLKINTHIQLGDSWRIIYCTAESLYLVSTISSNYYKAYIIDETIDTNLYNYITSIIRFELTNDVIDFAGTISTEGKVNNQFFLDEYNGYIRVLLDDVSWGDGSNRLEIYKSTIENNKKILNRVGSITEGIGKPGENIKSVRFNKDECLVVTFLQTDPLYKIDLTNPRTPKILGAFEEAGYNASLQYLTGKHS